jgi:thiamine-phosphate pyrophosphorylase
MKGFYFITDSALSLKGNIYDVQQAVLAGVVMIQYRQKECSGKTMYEEAARLKAASSGIPFIVNDRVDVALAVNADGVHLGEEDLPYEKARELLGTKKIIGLSVHSAEQARWAEEKGVDYLGIGPIFTTQTKVDAKEPCGVEMIREIKTRCRLPIVAIGGIRPDNVTQVIQAGADAVCAISGTVAMPDVKKAIEEFQLCFTRGDRGE